MKKLGKWSVALAIGATMGLSLFSSGAFAQTVNSNTSNNQAVAHIGAVASYQGGQHNNHAPVPTWRYHKPIVVHKPIVIHKPVVFHKPVVYHKPIVFHKPVVIHKPVVFHKPAPFHR